MTRGCAGDEAANERCLKGCMMMDLLDPFSLGVIKGAGPPGERSPILLKNSQVKLSDDVLSDLFSHTFSLPVYCVSSPNT